MNKILEWSAWNLSVSSVWSEFDIWPVFETGQFLSFLNKNLSLKWAKLKFDRSQYNNQKLAGIAAA